MKTMNVQGKIARNSAIFVIPFYGDQDKSPRYLKECIEKLFEQTDSNWHAIIVDDASPGETSRNCLHYLEKKYASKVSVLWQRENVGQGRCRNIAIQWAFERDYPITLFNDADDLSHPERLEVVRENFLTYPSVDLVYSSFQVIDENGGIVPRSQIAPGIIDIIDAIHAHPVEGYNAWITIGTITGFACLPSSTAVRTSVAYECPFPDERVSEDSYAWMNISARGSAFKFTPLIPSSYRIPSYAKGSSYRSRIGKKAFYQEKARVDTASFINAIHIALAKEAISHDQAEALKAQFFQKLAETLRNEDEVELADSVLMTVHHV